VLVLHLALGWLLMQQRLLPEPPAKRTELRLIVTPKRPPIPLLPPPEPRRPTPPPRAAAPVAQETPNLTPGPNAITLPPATEASVSVAAPAASGTQGLNLGLPKDWKPELRTSPAQQAIHDPRANSPRPSADERMAAAIAKGDKEVTWTRIEMADGGYMMRGSNGDCRRVLPNMAKNLGLIEAAPEKSGGCFSGTSTGVHHARPR
jgi:hypothetical protein